MQNVAIQAINEKARGVQSVRCFGRQDGHIRRRYCSLGLRFELTIVTHLLAQVGSASLEARTGEYDDAFGSLTGRFNSMKAPSAEAASEAAAAKKDESNEVSCET